MTALDALTSVAVIAAVGVIVVALEDLATARDFRDSALMSWEICRLRAPWSSRGLIGGWLDLILKQEHFRVLLVLRLVAAVVVAAGAAFGELVPAAIFVVFASSLALSVRSPYGLDGAHQMFQVVFGALLLASFGTTNKVVTTAAAAFIAAQVLLAYLISGATKAASPRWRSGDAIAGVMATAIYGDGRLYAIMKNRSAIAWLTCWAVIVLECGFPVAALAGAPYQGAFLAAGFAFHAMTALTMGLNGFLFAFVATYPCLVYLPSAWNDLV